MSIDFVGMSTEARNANTMNLDEMSSLEIVTHMNMEDAKVAYYIKPHLEVIASIIDEGVKSISNGGRIIYIGAGTSGRLGVLDAVECPPTFGVSPDLVVGLIAGGEKAFVKAVEGAEDSKELGKQDLENLNLNPNDLVVGLAASGRTPYVIGGLEYANAINCMTASLSCNSNSEISKVAKIPIECPVGPEVLTGSTRLKAGTAEKMILNMISTGVMVKSGKAYQNLMVDVIQTNEKLERRAERIVMEATGVNQKEAREKIDEADGSCKVAITSILCDCSALEAKEKLEKTNGHIKEAIKLREV